LTYRIKQNYQSARSAEWYNSQYSDSLRAKLADWGERRAFRTLLDRVPSSQRVLDVACGTGRFLEELADRGYQVTGVDVSPHMLDVARRRVGHRSQIRGFELGDAEHLPYDDGAFDGVTCMRLYHKVPAPARLEMLREVRRVGNGWAILFFAISTPWLDTRRAVLAGVRHHPVDRFALTHAQLRRELDQTGLCLKQRAWVMPVVFEGLVTLVTW
jgi:ubiquinone/menaquinone biosynthesis C-methylase UbiE